MRIQYIACDVIIYLYYVILYQLGYSQELFVDRDVINVIDPNEKRKFSPKQLSQKRCQLCGLPETWTIYFWNVFQFEVFCFGWENKKHFIDWQSISDIIDFALTLTKNKGKGIPLDNECTVRWSI